MTGGVDVCCCFVIRGGFFPTKESLKDLSKIKGLNNNDFASLCKNGSLNLFKWKEALKFFMDYVIASIICCNSCSHRFLGHKVVYLTLQKL